MLTLVVIFLPLLFSAILFGLRKSQIAWRIALMGALAELVVTLIAFVGFDTQNVFNYTSDLNWISRLGVNFSFAMDGISLLMVGLTATLVPIIILADSKHNPVRPGSFYGLIMFMQSALMGVFTATDGLLFYIFWEAALLPIFFIVSMWGGENRVKITLKFFIYTIFGSLFMLVALVYLYSLTPAPQSFSFQSLYALDLSLSQQLFVGLSFFLAFAVKIPIFPFHTWQPNTYVVAPMAGSMLLSGIMLKMGVYGMLRLMVPLLPEAMSQYGIYGIVLAVIGLIYASIIAINQQEVKRLIAYSSLAHVGLIAAAVLTATAGSISGAVVQMIAHGVNVVGMFMIANIFLLRTQTTQISNLGGIAAIAPRFAIFFMVVMLGSVALPLTSGFPGEFMMLAGLFAYNPYIAAVAGVSVVLGAVYMFRLYQRSMYAELKVEKFEDLDSTESIAAIIIVALILVFGLYPGFITSLAEPAINALLAYKA